MNNLMIAFHHVWDVHTYGYALRQNSVSVNFVLTCLLEGFTSSKLNKVTLNIRQRIRYSVNLSYISSTYGLVSYRTVSM